MSRSPHTDSRQPRQALRQSWMEAVVNELQLGVGRALWIDPSDTRVPSGVSLLTIPKPETYTERLFLRGLLLEFTRRFATAVHTRAHRGNRGDCEFVTATRLERLFLNVDDPIDAFNAWVVAFFEEFRRTHPRTAAQQAAAIMRDDFRRQWTLRTLAATVHLTPSTLARVFGLEYGLSPREYQRTLRVIAAIEDVRSVKVASAALNVGYRSAKNFYRAFQRLTGLTPAAVHKLSRQEAERLMESARLLLAGRRVEVGRSD